MENVISEITLSNLAFNVNDASRLSQKVIIHNILDDRYMVTIQIGDWKTRIHKDDLKRVIG